MYSASDPRATLAPAAPSGPAAPTAVGYPADYVVFGDSECAASMTARRAGQPDEWMLLLPGQQTRARISAGGKVAHTAGYSLAVIPPGDSEIEITGSGQVVRIFSGSAADLGALAVNAGSYTRDHLNVAPWAPWP